MDRQLHTLGIITVFLYHDSRRTQVGMGWDGHGSYGQEEIRRWVAVTIIFERFFVNVKSVIRGSAQSTSPRWIIGHEICLSRDLRIAHTLASLIAWSTMKTIQAVRIFVEDIN